MSYMSILQKLYKYLQLEKYNEFKNEFLKHDLSDIYYDDLYNFMYNIIDIIFDNINIEKIDIFNFILKNNMFEPNDETILFFVNSKLKNKNNRTYILCLDNSEFVSLVFNYELIQEKQCNLFDKNIISQLNDKYKFNIIKNLRILDKRYKENQKLIDPPF